MFATQTYQQQLGELLGTDAEDAESEQRAAWHRSGCELLRPTVLHGAGELGLHALGRLRQAGREPACFTDNSPKLWGTYVDGVPVLRPTEAVERWGSSAQFIVTVFNPGAGLDQLAEAGAAVVAPWHLMYHGEPDLFLPYACVDRPSAVLQASERILQLAEILADDESVRLLVEQIAWRLAPHAVSMSPRRPIKQLYFDSELVQLSGHERFVDCGAFDGDTLDHFLQYSQGSLDRADLIEADPSNLTAMRRRIGHLPSDIEERVHIHPFALGRERRTQRITSTGTTASRVTSGEGLDVAMATLDSLVPHNVTIVKMDVEGAELDVLAGAEAILSNGPIWAVMTYHRPDHLWEVPLTIAAGGQYTLHMRRYAEDCWETCAYALPTDRH